MLSANSHVNNDVSDDHSVKKNVNDDNDCNDDVTEHVLNEEVHDNFGDDVKPMTGVKPTARWVFDDVMPMTTSSQHDAESMTTSSKHRRQ